MPLPSSPPTDMLGHHFLRLPRELRDCIYPYVVSEDAPIQIVNTPVYREISQMSTRREFLEALFTHNTFVVIFPIPNRNIGSQENINSSIWSLGRPYKKFIRHLIVEVREARLLGYDLKSLEWECTEMRPQFREHWEELLNFPRLESLVVNMQKYESNHFSWADFSPILYQLRSRLPKLKITFNVSFDDFLKYFWDESYPDEEYEPMGFIDISDLIQAPDEEDRAYVETYILRKDLEANKGRDLVGGLLTENRVNRRMLGSYYVAKEPSLMRMLMEEHWELYKKRKQDRREREELQNLN